VVYSTGTVQYSTTLLSISFIDKSHWQIAINHNRTKDSMSEEKSEEDIEAATPETGIGEEEKEPEESDEPAAKTASKEMANKPAENKTKKEQKLNPKFKDVQDTGKWGEIGKTEICMGVGLLFFVIIGAVVALALTSGEDEAPAEVEPRPAPMPTASPTMGPATPEVKLEIVIQALENSENVGTLADASSLPRDVAFYDGLATQDSAPAHQRAMSWLLSTEYDQYDDLEEYSLRFALASIYYQLGGETWERSTSWLSSTDICDWEGIACEIGSDEFRELFLDRNNLSGTIPLEIALLDGATKIWLSHNQLQGTIPGGSFGELTDLKVLYLENNQLTGDIPESLNPNKLLGEYTYWNWSNVEESHSGLVHSLKPYYYYYYELRRYALRPAKQLDWYLAVLPGPF
jgi:Leucine-rich repeat (LRR) protein